MGLVFPFRRVARGPVPVTRVPSAPGGRATYLGWVGLGAFVVAFLYPLAVAGFALRVPIRRIGRTAASFGVGGVVGVSAVAWVGLAAVALLLLPGEIPAAVAASTVLAALVAVATVFSRTGGRVTTVLLAYPVGVATLILPPVVVALSLGTPLDGPASVGVGSGITVALGWVLGCAVGLADLVRPSRRGRI